MIQVGRVFTVIGFALTLWCYHQSAKFHCMTQFPPGPGFMSSWVGVVLAVC